MSTIVRGAIAASLLLAFAGGALSQASAPMAASDAAAAASAPAPAASAVKIVRRATLDLNDSSCHAKRPAQTWDAHGTTIVQFIVDEHAHVVQSRVYESSGVSRAHSILDEAALQAIANCPFHAGLDEAGHPLGGTFWGAYHW